MYTYQRIELFGDLNFDLAQKCRIKQMIDAYENVYTSTLNVENVYIFCK